MSHRPGENRAPLDAIIPVSEAELRAQFDAATFRRGDEYQRRGNVLELSLNDDGEGPELTAAVRGSAGQTYRLLVAFGQGRRGTVCRTFCTCRMTVNCKHAVAALLQATRTGLTASPEPAPMPIAAPARPPAPPPPPIDPLAGPVGAWLGQLQEAARAGEVGQTGPGRKSGPAAEMLL